MLNEFGGRSYSRQPNSKRPISPVLKSRTLSMDMVVMSRNNNGATPNFSKTKSPEPVEPKFTPPRAPEMVTNVVTQQPISTKELPKNKARYSWRQAALTTAAVSVFVFGIGVSIMGLRTNTEVAAQSQQASQVDDENAGDHPDETKPDPSTVNSYQVAPELPLRITIAKIDVNARVTHLGTKKNNELKAPANIYDAGWYNSSSKPGQDGAMLIDGHVSGPTRQGVFYNLKSLKQGDVIEIERGDHKIFRYEVKKTQVYDKSSVDMKSLLTPIDADKQGLNLITCAGPFDKASQTYAQRLGVYASLLE